MRASYVGMVFCVGIAAFFTPQAFAAKNILYIFDASGSMAAQMPGGVKIDIARRALSERVKNLPDSGINAGLVVYGHRRKGDCGDIEELAKLQPLDKQALITRVKSIHPKGKTPIAAAIRLAVNQLKEVEEETTIILISDGQETCDPNPCAVVEQLKETGIDFTLHVIGFDVSEEERRQLECLAKAGGGIYVSASTAGKLDEALTTLTTPIVESIVKVQENIEIVLDTSATMRKPFEGKTKLAAAIQGLNKVLQGQVAERDNLAFRRFGGPCRQDNTQLLVNFGQNNAEQIRAAFASLRIDGETTMVEAVAKAAKDFGDQRRFDGVNKRVLIVTGGQDSCNPQAAEAMRQALLSQQIRPDFWFIGIDVPPDQQRQLSEIQRATKGKLAFVKTQEELENVLAHLFEVEPVIADVKTMIDILNSIGGHFNKASEFLSNTRYQEAEKEINKARKSLKETELPFYDLEKRLTRDDFRRLYEFSKKNRELQSQLLQIVESRIGPAKSDDRNSYNESVNIANILVDTYNKNIRNIDEILKKL